MNFAEVNAKIKERYTEVIGIAVLDDRYNVLFSSLDIDFEKRFGKYDDLSDISNEIRKLIFIMTDKYGGVPVKIVSDLLLLVAFKGDPIMGKTDEIIAKIIDEHFS